MNPKENTKLDKINKRMTILISIILGVMLCYFPLINSNTKRSTQAFDKAENIEKIINVKLDAVIEKLDVSIDDSKETQISMQKAIEDNRANYSELATKLLEKGVVTDLTFRSGKIN